MFKTSPATTVSSPPMEFAPPQGNGATSSPVFLAGGGEMGERMRRLDWSGTPLGPPEFWPQSLKTAVRIMLTSRQAIWIGWGPELIFLYNDAYRSIIGGRHPHALGQPTRDVWREIWPIIGPMLSTAMTGDEGTYVESQRLIMERNGYREETYYTFSYSPIPNDDESAGGIICANTDDTQRSIGERQLGLLRELSARTANARSLADAGTGIRDALAVDRLDLTFALIYLSQPDSPGLRLAEACGIGLEHPAAHPGSGAPSPNPWPLEEIVATRETLIVDDLAQRFASALPAGAGHEAPTRAALVPLSVSGRTGVLVAGLNPFRLVDENYRNFLNLVAGQIAAGLANAEAYQNERRRAESLAELDRAKTEFFSNVSHEFRTPLTLMLGPVEDLLARGHDDISPAARAQLETVYRNSLRLLKLVNTMLEFSRIEADRMTAHFVPVDLAAFTADLASVFRAAIERGGLRLIVSCPSLHSPAFVDRDMWEKIVLNLLSNAFKFTLAGEIEVRLDVDGEQLRLTVRDTGVGIPPAELPLVFRRFHRVQGSRGRTHEGTGIGLALVRELVHLHHGTINVESVVDQGSRFIVTIPWIRKSDDRRTPSPVTADPFPSAGSAAFVQEALRWSSAGEPARNLPSSPSLPPGEPARDNLPHIVWADDNADMRDYVGRLLAGKFAVTTVADGAAALEAIRANPPDLVLTDVMMPRLDGFGLLRALRGDPALKSIPVILLSARAGEEARVDGVEAGADDYLIKPFSARELLARVESHVKIRRQRREAETVLRREIGERKEMHRRLLQRTAQFETLLNQAPLGVYVVDADFRIRDVNPTARPVFGDIPDLIGRDFGEVIHRLWPAEYADLITRRFRHTLETGESYSMPEAGEYRADRISGEREYYEWRIDRIPLPDGRAGVVCYFRDISRQVEAQQQLKIARDDALAANRAKDEFLAALSHELRTPLNPVLLIASECAANQRLSEPIRNHFKTIEDNVSLQARLIDDLLDLNRITRGKLVLERRPLDLHTVIRDAATTVSDEIADKQIALTYSFEASSPVVDGDPVRLRQVFWNVLKNATKFTPAGGRIEIASTEVGAGGEIEVRIRDTGIGMDADELARVFNPFVQGRHVDDGHGSSYGGLGLGLAISRMVIEGHGGHIAAESAGPGQGTAIVVRLQRTSALQAHPDHRKTDTRRNGHEPATASFAGRRVLFVEDHAPTRNAMTTLLRLRGHEVTVAENMTEAVQQSHDKDFDVLISDLGLPDGDGCLLMTELRKRHPALPGIAISGYGMDADLLRSRDAGFGEHLTKPVSIETIERALRHLFAS